MTFSLPVLRPTTQPAANTMPIQAASIPLSMKRMRPGCARMDEAAELIGAAKAPRKGLKHCDARANNQARVSNVNAVTGSLECERMRAVMQFYGVDHAVRRR